MAPPVSPKSTFPYFGLPSQQYWSARASRDLRDASQEIAKFRLTDRSAVASAGSCFANRLAAGLRGAGLPYLVVEDDAGDLSARYGNIYTARQLLQLLQRALGLFEPLERVWEAHGGGFVDPFRPMIGATFETAARVESDRRQHLEAVRSMCERLDAFVFTLGLTERWTDARDGAVFPACPGRTFGTFDPERYRWSNGDVDETVDALESFVTLLQSINPRAKIVLTVSPVPNAATLLDMPIARASSFCKSVLKAAAETVVARNDSVDYLPSYEIALDPMRTTPAFASNGRDVMPTVVEDVLGAMLRRFYSIAVPDQVPPPAGSPASVISLQGESIDPCDEQILLDAIVRDASGRGTAPAETFSILYFVGDSHTLVFRDRMFAIAGARALLGRTLHAPGLHACDFSNDAGELNRLVRDALFLEQLLISDGRGGYTASRDAWSASRDLTARERERESLTPRVVFSCGNLDAIRLMEELRMAEIDLPSELRRLPAQGAGGAAVRTTTEVVSYEHAVAVANRYVAPLERGLERLANVGLEGASVLGLPPPTASDEIFAGVFFPIGVRARYDAYALVNGLLRDLCRRIGMRFVDVWDDLTGPDGTRDERFALDLVHVNRLGAEAIVRRIAAAP